MKKKLVYGIMVAAVLSLAGCGSTTPATSDNVHTDIGTGDSVSISTEADNVEDTTEDSSNEEDAANVVEDDNAGGIELGVAPGAEDAGAVVTEVGELTAGSFAASDLDITVNGVKLVIGEDFLPNVDKVGDAEVVEGQACLDGGFDTNYYYGGEDLVVYTLAQSGKQIIYDIYITSPDYATGKGATVGTTTKDDLYEMYGEATTSTGATLKYSVAGSEISMDFSFGSDGVLESIDIINNGING